MVAFWMAAAASLAESSMSVRLIMLVGLWM